MTRESFFSGLTALSHRCNYELTAFDFELYGQEAEKLGWETAVAAITNIYKETPQGGRFPPLNELADRANPAGLKDEDLAREAAALIKSNLRLGYNRPEDAEQVLKGLAWEVVRMSGGWSAVCTSISHDDMLPTLYAQWRDLALALLRKAKAGVSGPPQLPESSKPHALIEDLCQDLDRTRKPKKLPETDKE